MKKRTTLIILGILVALVGISQAQTPIPMDTTHWKVEANAHLWETYHGQEAIYIQGGVIALKDVEFLNGTIEFDLFLKQEQAFPGVYFRVQEEELNGEQFYIRPHLPGKEDANQAVPYTQGITAWQLYFGPSYSFPYEYKYDDWTHVKIVVKDQAAQVFLDYAEWPQLSWELTHPAKAGRVYLSGGNRSGLHISNVTVNTETPTLVDYAPITKEPLEGLVQEWEISDKFEESALDDLDDLEALIADRNWQGTLAIEQGTAANISRIQRLRDGEPGNTVFVKVTLSARAAKTVLFEFGYSDRAVVLLNGQPLYRGTNGYRTR
ncbi:MAG: hypothetical protein AAFQ98_25220, partial [Bacteroidota bacterium]